MIEKNIFKKAIVISLVIIFCSLSISQSSVVSNSLKFKKGTSELIQEDLLPEPEFIDMPLEESIMRRMSMRDFTEEPVSEEDLSTILWSAYGLRDDGELTVPEINGAHAVIIYVLLEDVYTYNPINHSLVFYKEGDYREIVGWQYSAPLVLGLCYNSDILDENLASAQIGAVGQNIYFAANAIGLGTVITAEIPPAINPVGLPSNHKGIAVMPMGHLTIDYNFEYRPMLFSFLPRVKFSNTELTKAFETRNEVTSWDSDSISRKGLSHLIWASYGYSYYLDQSNSNVVKRHHTVPSAHGYYPFRIYAANKDGIFRYMYGLSEIDLWGLPVLSYLLPISFNDKRTEISQSTESFASDAPLNIIIVLDIEMTNQWDDLSSESLRWIWYYEAGAAAHNVLLEATSLGLNGNILEVHDKDNICSLLNLEKEKFDPMLVVPVG